MQEEPQELPQAQTPAAELRVLRGVPVTLSTRLSPLSWVHHAQGTQMGVHRRLGLGRLLALWTLPLLVRGLSLPAVDRPLRSRWLQLVPSIGVPVLPFLRLVVARQRVEQPQLDLFRLPHRLAALALTLQSLLVALLHPLQPILQWPERLTHKTYRRVRRAEEPHCRPKTLTHAVVSARWSPLLGAVLALAWLNPIEPPLVLLRARVVQLVPLVALDVMRVREE